MKCKLKKAAYATGSSKIGETVRLATRQPKRLLTGFTMIELLIVVVILGILTVILMINILGAQKKTRDSKRSNDTAAIKKAMDLYYQEKGEYLPCNDGGGFLYCNESTEFSSLSGYLGSAYPADPKPFSSGFTYYHISEQPDQDRSGNLIDSGYGILIPYELKNTRGCQSTDLNYPGRCGCMIGDGNIHLGWWSDLSGNITPLCK